MFKKLNMYGKSQAQLTERTNRIYVSTLFERVKNWDDKEERVNTRRCRVSYRSHVWRIIDTEGILSHAKEVTPYSL